MSLPAPAARPRLRRTSGGTLLPRVDGRTLAAKRYRTVLEEFEAEVGSSLSAIDRAMLAQAAALIVRSEVIQAEIVAGKAPDCDEAVRLASESRRILSSLRTKATENKPEDSSASINELFSIGGAATE